MPRPLRRAVEAAGAAEAAGEHRLPLLLRAGAGVGLGQRQRRPLRQLLLGRRQSTRSKIALTGSEISIR